MELYTDHLAAQHWPNAFEYSLASASSKHWVENDVPLQPFYPRTSATSQIVLPVTPMIKRETSSPLTIGAGAGSESPSSTFNSFHAQHPHLQLDRDTTAADMWMHDPVVSHHEHPSSGARRWTTGSVSGYGNPTWSAQTHVDSLSPSYHVPQRHRLSEPIPYLSPHSPASQLSSPGPSSPYSVASGSLALPQNVFPPHNAAPFSSTPAPSNSLKASPKQAAGPSGKVCSHCHATQTPLWRRDPITLRTLCNACGLYLQQRKKLRPQKLIDADIDESSQSDGEDDDGKEGPQCSHCKTRNTSVWRRSKTGAQLCNACGVYIRLKGRERPLSLRRKKIKPRTKHSKA